MSDLVQWNIHGRVETLRTEWAKWDQAKNDWQPSTRRTSVRFRPDGRIIGIEAFNPDGSVARTACVYNDAGRILETRLHMNDGPVSRIASSYDGAGRIIRTVNIDEKGVGSESEIYRYHPSGRKTKIQFLPKVEGHIGYSVDVEGGAALFGASGAATMTTAYDEHDRASEVTLHDDVHRLLRRMTLTHDSTGRLVKQELQAGTTPVFPELQLLVTITCAYDEKGRQVERNMTMGTLGGERTTFRFDDHDNPVEEITEDKQHSRSIYKYDAEGNWTEREAGTVVDSSREYQRLHRLSPVD
jgi:hypothetical protein